MQVEMSESAARQLFDDFLKPLLDLGVIDVKQAKEFVSTLLTWKDRLTKMSADDLISCSFPVWRLYKFVEGFTDDIYPIKFRRCYRFWDILIGEYYMVIVFQIQEESNTVVVQFLDVKKCTE